MKKLIKILKFIEGVYNILSFIFVMLFTLVLVVCAVGSVSDILKK